MRHCSADVCILRSRPVAVFQSRRQLVREQLRYMYTCASRKSHIAARRSDVLLKKQRILDVCVCACVLVCVQIAVSFGSLFGLRLVVVASHVISASSRWGPSRSASKSVFVCVCLFLFYIPLFLKGPFWKALLERRFWRATCLESFFCRDY
jgi:hypothetical protein